MKEEILKEFAVVHDEFVDNGTMHILTGEFVGVAVDDFGHAGEVVGDLFGVGVDDEIIITRHILQKIAIIRIITCQRSKLDQMLAIVNLLLP